MTAEVHFDVGPLVDVLRRLETRGHNLSGLTPVIAEILRVAVDDVFDVKGPGWPDLADSTKAAKARRWGAGQANKLLQAGGNLRESIHGEHGQDWAEAATNVPYVVYHLDGGPIIPQRNPFLIDEDPVAEEVANLLLNEIVR